MTANRKPAKSGLDFIRGPNWEPLAKTRKGWQQYADRLAARHSKRDGLLYHGILWECDTYIRVNIAANYRTTTKGIRL